jgi:hypothetical protein
MLKEATVIIERNVFQAKYGKGDELVALFKEMRKVAPPAFIGRNPRLLTDRSGPFFTVVIESEWENLAEWERAFGLLFTDAKVRDIMARSTPLIESGRREFYNVEM